MFYREIFFLSSCVVRVISGRESWLTLVWPTPVWWSGGGRGGGEERVRERRRSGRSGVGRTGVERERERILTASERL